MSPAACSALVIVVHYRAVLPRGLFGIETLAPPSEARRDISSHNYFSFLRHENEPEPEPKPTLSGCSSVYQATLSAAHPLTPSPYRLKRLDAFHFPDATLTGDGCILFCQTWRILITSFVASCLLIILFYSICHSSLFCLPLSHLRLPSQLTLAWHLTLWENSLKSQNFKILKLLFASWLKHL